MALSASVTGGVKNGTLGRDFVGMNLLGWQLDLMVLEVFSSLNISMILFTSFG